MTREKNSDRSGLIEIVTHCWAGQLDIYAYLLQYQLSSLILRSSDCKVTVTVVYSEDDGLVEKILTKLAFGLKHNGIHLNPLCVSHNCLFRRACGRNLAALNTVADVVWFTDCDYLFGDQALSAALRTCLEHPGTITYPQTVYASGTRQSGDKLIYRAPRMEDAVLGTNLKDFVAKRYRRAIGGIQIIDGNYCRENGYLAHSQWSKPLEKVSGFRSCRCDIKFRKYVGSSISADIPNVFRIRHSERGRDADY